jgi:hypothetical protein
MLRLILKEVSSHRHRCPKSLAIVDIEPHSTDYLITSYSPSSPSLRPPAKARLSHITVGTWQLAIGNPLPPALAALASLLATQSTNH